MIPQEHKNFAELEYLQKVQEGKEKPDVFIRDNIKRHLI